VFKTAAHGCTKKTNKTESKMTFLYNEDCKKLYEVMKDGTWHTLVQLRKEASVDNPHKRMSDMRKQGYVIETFRRGKVTHYKLVHCTVPVVDDRVQFPEINEVRSHKRNEEMLIEQMNRVRVLAAHCGNRDIERTAERALMAAGVSVGN